MLTDEQIKEIGWLWAWINMNLPEEQHKFARAIEAAACAERDARIAELEIQLAEARSQVAEECAKVCDELEAPASCVGVEKSLWDVATMAAGDAIRERFKAQP